MDVNQSLNMHSGFLLDQGFSKCGPQSSGSCNLSEIYLEAPDPPDRKVWGVVQQSVLTHSAWNFDMKFPHVDIAFSFQLRFTLTLLGSFLKMSNGQASHPN